MNLKFISLNLFEGGLLFDNIKDFLKEENPDIVAFQEVNNGIDLKLPSNLRSIQVLSKILPDYDYFFAPALSFRHPEGMVDMGNAIFSRFPIFSEQTVFFHACYAEYDTSTLGGDYSQLPRNMQCCQVMVADTPVHVCNVHGIWGGDGTDNPDRLHMSEVIVNQIKGKERLILAGDFNVKPNTQTVAHVEKYLTNVFKDELSTSFNLARKDLDQFPGYASAVVDMIFTSNDLVLTTHSCPQVDVSDHLPLVIEIEV